ncbi:hypothetical protein KYK29_05330 [Shinella daejeonensis]|uniref:glycosyl hydrolase 108 family protein n=1 Tax=Shinella daejeonensis TaxID=659017 RepID=UPI0020C764F5|nr:glycosyl hydrolase 108 family protein [Shinella daejeonensis]MCP8894344.1 hypothetical protein [Shinella daejeonensis]
MVEEIYRADYRAPIRGDTLAAGVDLATFDYGVNSGPATAPKQLLKVIGGSNVNTVKKLCARWLTSYQALKTWATFGKGWASRIAGIEAKAVAWAMASSTPAQVKDALNQEAKAANSKSARQAAGRRRRSERQFDCAPGRTGKSRPARRVGADGAGRRSRRAGGVPADPHPHQQGRRDAPQA